MTCRAPGASHCLLSYVLIRAVLALGAGLLASLDAKQKWMFSDRAGSLPAAAVAKLSGSSERRVLASPGYCWNSPERLTRSQGSCCTWPLQPPKTLLATGRLLRCFAACLQSGQTME